MQIRIILIIFICSVFIRSLSFAGNEADSLKKLLTETHNSSRKIELYTALSKSYKRNNSHDTASYFAREGANLSEQTGDRTYIRDIYGLLGDIAIMQDSLELAKEYYLLTLNHAEEQNNIEDLTIFSLVLGNIDFVQDNLVGALRYYHQAAKYAKESGQTKQLNFLNMNIGSINFRLRNIESAQEYAIKALNGFIESGDSINIAGSYANLALTYSYLNNNSEAEKYFKQSLDIYLKLDASASIAETYTNIAGAEYKKENYGEAIALLNKALEYTSKQDSYYKGPRQTLEALIYERLGANYQMLSELDKAYPYYLKGYMLANLNRKLETISASARGLSEIWNSWENTDSAYYYLGVHKVYSDSVNNIERVKEQTLQNARFEYEQLLAGEQLAREKETAKQTRNKYFLVFVIVGLLLLLVVLVLLLKLGRNRVKRAELEQQTLRHELDLRKKELELRNKELTTHVLYQVKNNEFTLDLVEKLKSTLTDETSENKAQINAVIKEIERESSHETWKEFELRFQNVYTDFYKKLSQDYPGLTANELRICAFLKLNMSTKDIAAITYQTDSSIRVARWRLRQKFKLEKEENLVSFLAKY